MADRIRRFRRLGLMTAACMALAALAACSSTEKPGDSGMDRAMNRTSAGIGDAALAPLGDLNLRRAPIPPRLERIISPYEPIKDPTCVKIAAEVQELTAILGDDFDAPARPGDTLGQQAGDSAANAALDGVEGAVTDFIPYRSLIRMASGATAHEKKLREVYARGASRRTYLKGVGASMGCAPPAAPLPMQPKKSSKVEYRATPAKAPTQAVVFKVQ